MGRIKYVLLEATVGKNLERLYKESGLTEEARTFLNAFFAACANLYGAIALRHVWGIYRELKDAPKLRRKDMLTFASIVRREEQPYYVFEVNELFDEDSNNELNRHIVSKELVHVGYGKFPHDMADLRRGPLISKREHSLEPVRYLSRKQGVA